MVSNCRHALDNKFPESARKLDELERTFERDFQQILRAEQAQDLDAQIWTKVSELVESAGTAVIIIS
jgi:hypothetical protein